MFAVEFQTGALLLLGISTLIIAYLLWMNRSERIETGRQALEGVGHELRINIQRFMAELAAITRGETVMGGDLMPIHHPQLDAIYSQMVPANRNALSVIGATYQTLVARKADIRAAYAHNADPNHETPSAIDAVIDAIVTLYMWEEHGGRRPQDAHATRSWHVRDWMKSHGMAADIFPNMHLRDAVVERLRTYGMKLTPKPLTHTAHEYYSMRYDRYSDPRSPFGKRKQPKPEEMRIVEQAPAQELLESPDDATAR